MCRVNFSLLSSYFYFFFSLVFCSLPFSSFLCTADRYYYHCNSDRFLCDTMWCIPRDEVCDGHTDCDDGTDEECCGNDVCGRNIVAVVAAVVIIIGTVIAFVICVIVCLVCVARYRKRSTVAVVRHTRLANVTVHTSETDGHHATVTSAEVGG